MARVNQLRRTGTTGSDATGGAVRIGPRRRWPPTWLPLSRWPIPTPDGTGCCDRGPLEARAQWRGGIRTRGPCVRRRWQPTQAQPPSSPDEQRQCRARSRRARSHQVPPWLSPCVDSNELDFVQRPPRMPAACGSCPSDRQRRTTWPEIGGYERLNRRRRRSRNGTIRNTATAKYSPTASLGRASPARIAITYAATTGQSCRRSVCKSSSASSCE
jgi:hypothetical protein